jgi:small multidrug resistance pump/quaternary ammonium compound-resistance protein SugE
MPLTLCLLSALAFTVGGIFMKAADGPRASFWTVGFLTLFGVGAALQAQALRGAALGPTYLVVLGLEAALALAFGTLFFAEPVTVNKLAAVLLIVSGIALLRIE